MFAGEKNPFYTFQVLLQKMKGKKLLIDKPHDDNDELNTQ